MNQFHLAHAKTVAPSHPSRLVPVVPRELHYPLSVRPLADSIFTPPPEVSDNTGRLYTIATRTALGSGGMSVVYPGMSGEDSVAVKFLHPTHTAGVRSTWDCYVRILRKEVSALGRLNHPNIVSLHGFNFDIAHPFVAMELIFGRNLLQFLNGVIFIHPTLIKSILGQVSSALKETHRKGLVHRDVKPANIMIVESEGRISSVKLTDFGTAEFIVNNTRGIAGTPIYMAPEKMDGEQHSPAADVYSLAAVAYELACGEHPFDPYCTSILQLLELKRNIAALRDPNLVRLQKSVAPLSSDFTHVLVSSLNPDPVLRPSLNTFQNALSEL